MKAVTVLLILAVAQWTDARDLIDAMGYGVVYRDGSAVATRKDGLLWRSCGCNMQPCQQCRPPPPPPCMCQPPPPPPCMECKPPPPPPCMCQPPPPPPCMCQPPPPPPPKPCMQPCQQPAPCNQCGRKKRSLSSDLMKRSFRTIN